MELTVLNGFGNSFKIPKDFGLELDWLLTCTVGFISTTDTLSTQMEPVPISPTMKLSQAVLSLSMETVSENV